MTLANAVFSTLPGVFRACMTLANAVFLVCQGCLGRARPWQIQFFPLCQGCATKIDPVSAFFVLPVVAHIVTSISAPQHHFQRRSTFHRAANVISSGTRFSPRRQRHFQRCSASYRAANVISNGAPLSIAPLRSYPIAHHQKKRRENPSLS